MAGKHTPGPWRSTGLEYEPEAGWFVREGGGSRYLAVARVAATYRPTEEIEANARLIAAAPDLLEALEAARKHVALLDPADMGGVAEIGDDGEESLTLSIRDVLLAKFDAALTRAHPAACHGADPEPAEVVG